MNMWCTLLCFIFLMNVPAQTLEEKEQYNKLITYADSLFDGGFFEKALPLYERAYILNPQDSYPYNQLLQIRYPEGVQETITYTKNRLGAVVETTTIRIVRRNNLITEYRKVKRKWGTHYTKNGMTITEYTWDIETVE